VAETAALRPRPGSTVGYATRIALRELGRRAQFPDRQLERLDELIVPLVTARAPGLLALRCPAFKDATQSSARPRRLCRTQHRTPTPCG
jgi:hypothetical protein